MRLHFKYNWGIPGLRAPREQSTMNVSTGTKPLGEDKGGRVLNMSFRKQVSPSRGFRALAQLTAEEGTGRHTHTPFPVPFGQVRNGDVRLRISLYNTPN